MSGVTREDKIWDKYVRGSILVASVVNRMRKNGLRWFGHVMRQKETNAIKVVMKINVKRKKRKREIKKEMVGYD